MGGDRSDGRGGDGSIGRGRTREGEIRSNNQPPRPPRSKGLRAERQRPYARVDVEEGETIIERGVEGAASSGTGGMGTRGDRGGLLM